MPLGKPAFVRCIQLSETNACLLFGAADRPAVCTSLRPERDMCGDRDSDAFFRLEFLEQATRPR